MMGETASNRKTKTGFSVPDAHEMFGYIEHMYSLGPRRSGSEADHRCEDYLAEQLSSYGFADVRKDPIPMRVWRPVDYKLSVNYNRGRGFEDVPASYIPYTKFTGVGGVEGKLLYVNPFDFATRVFRKWRGCIVVAEIHFPELNTDELSKFAIDFYDPDGTMKGTSRFAVWVRMFWSLYREAAERGAAGFIGILSDHYAGGHNYFAPYGFKEKDIHNKPIPGFWVDRMTGAKIVVAAKSGNARARLFLTGTLVDGITHNVIGVLPGTTNETFIIASHHDSPFNSAVEDASGCAVVLGAAKHFAKTRELRHTLITLFTAGHFYGSIGTRTFIERNKGELLDKVALEFHVEHIAKEAIERNDGSIETVDRPDFVGAFVPFNRRVRRAVRNAVVTEDLQRTMLLPPHGPLGEFPPTDGGDFHLEGIPVVNFISPPIYLLNEEDTLDKVATERLEPTARTVIDVLRRLDFASLDDLRRIDYPLQASLMHGLKHIVKIKAAFMGI